VVELRTERYPVRLTLKRRLQQVDFVFDGNRIRGLEQNPETKSRWALMARSGNQAQCCSDRREDRFRAACVATLLRKVKVESNAEL